MTWVSTSEVALIHYTPNEPPSPTTTGTHFFLGTSAKMPLSSTGHQGERTSFFEIIETFFASFRKNSNVRIILADDYFVRRRSDRHLSCHGAGLGTTVSGDQCVQGTTIHRGHTGILAVFTFSSGPRGHAGY